METKWVVQFNTQISSRGSTMSEELIGTCSLWETVLDGFVSRAGEAASGHVLDHAHEEATIHGLRLLPED